MKPEEAINLIEEFMVIDDWSLVYLPDLHDALELAIEALEENERLAKSLNEACELLRKKRPHGEWIHHKHDKDFECSVCHYRFDEDEFGLEIPQDNTTWIKVCVYNFCPCCGSDNRKRGEADG